jgi:hypothetical protein
MSTERDVNRIVRSWLDEGVTALPDRVLDAVLDQLPATPQRHTFGLARRFPLMSNSVRIALAATAVVAVALIGFQLLTGPSVVGPGPSPSEPSTPAPSDSAPSSPPTSVALPTEMGALLHEGTTYLLSSFAVPITFQPITVESGTEWAACSENELELNLCFFRGDAPPKAGIGFLTVENVVADPCDPTQAGLEPPVGPSVDDLVTAISNLQGFEATTPVDLNVDGFEGKQFTITAPATVPVGCEGFATWLTALRANGVGPGEVNLVHVFDVNGERVVINAAYHPGLTSESDLASVQAVLDSVRIEP